MSFPARSPICRAALTLAELRRLSPGTRLILFDAHDRSQREMTYPGIEGLVGFPDQVTLVTLVEGWSWRPGQKTMAWGTCVLPPFNFGLVPLADYGWNKRRVLVWEGNAHALPTRRWRRFFG